MATAQPISVVAFGALRNYAMTRVVPLFEGTPYVLSATMHLDEPQTQYNYSAYNLGVILRALNPRPKALIVGVGITEDVYVEAQAVWKEYVEEKEVKDALVFKLKSGLEEMMPKLDDHFRG